MVPLLLSLALAAPEIALESDGKGEMSDVPKTRSAGAMPAEVLEAARSVADNPLASRMDAISKALLGRPYLVDPLGEGSGVDADPLARYDVFDCLTYVEEVLALSLAGDPAHAAWIRNALRYGDASPSYEARRHFMELQWIPGNIEDGWLRDSTSDYGPTVRLEREWTLPQWKNWAGRAKFHHTDEQLPVGTMTLEVLPLEVAREAADRIRPGSILLTVREDKPWKPLWITHVGFVFRGEQGPVTRHATKMGSGGTRDHSLTWYFDKLETYSNWKTLGVAILEPVESGPRNERL